MSGGPDLFATLTVAGDARLIDFLTYIARRFDEDRNLIWEPLGIGLGVLVDSYVARAWSERRTLDALDADLAEDAT